MANRQLGEGVGFQMFFSLRKVFKIVASQDDSWSCGRFFLDMDIELYHDLRGAEKTVISKVVSNFTKAGRTEKGKSYQNHIRLFK